MRGMDASTLDGWDGCWKNIYEDLSASGVPRSQAAKAHDVEAVGFW
jgi:hypothetical protein